MDRDISDQKAQECRALTVPPVDPNSAVGAKYNTVTGNTGGSQVWIVYENGRACALRVTLSRYHVIVGQSLPTLI